MQTSHTNHYATLGLDHDCSLDDIRNAYRLLAKIHHPDLNPNSSEALRHTQQLNAAYETLSDPKRRSTYDRELNAPKSTASGQLKRNITQDVHLHLTEFLRGTELEVRVKDPANPTGSELYPLTIPPNTAPGTRFRVQRTGPFAGSNVLVRVRPRPDPRFKVRGSDLRCDLRISAQRATQGGTEFARGLGGSSIRIDLPRNVPQGHILRLPGEGLPKPRGGFGDLLIRITYRPQVTIKRRPR